MSAQLFNACIILPLALILFAWVDKNRRPIEFSILTLSAVLLNLVNIRSAKLALLGGDYTPRLFATIEVNLIIAVGLGIFLGIKRSWIAAIAALTLAFYWFLVWAVNAAV